jgi:hypothetical protein
MKRVFTVVLAAISLNAFGQFDDATRFAETITQDDLRDKLSILASDAMEGRETGERGQKMAAAFIAYNFEEMGLKPVVPDGDNFSYYQKFALQHSAPGEIYVSVDGSKKVNGEDLIYWGSKTMAAPEKIDVVFAAKGSEDVYAQVDVAGKAVVIDGVGEGFQVWRKLMETAQANKASITFLIVADDAEGYAPQLAQFRRYFLRGSLGFKSPEDENPAGGVFLLSKELAAQFLNTDASRLDKVTKDFSEGKATSLKKVKPYSVEYKVTQDVKDIWTENVLGYLEGSDKKEELVVVTAHYDHIGRNGEQINNGADDDGSGTSSVIEIAQAFVDAKKAGNGPRRSMLFMTVTGEEKGLLGSQYYVENPIFPLENTVVDLNIDMIGRHDEAHEENQDFVYLVGSDKLSYKLHELSEMTNNSFTNMSLDYTYNDEDHPDRIYYRSDHWNFAKNNIPIIFYFTGIHDDYHKPSDTIDKIEFDMLEKRARLVFYTAWVVANRDNRLVVDKLQDTQIDSKN